MSSSAMYPVYMELVGQTQGYQDVEIRARVEGYLTNVAFQEGSLRAQGRPALRDRPPAARSHPCRGQGQPGHRRGAGWTRPTTTSPATAAGGQAGGEPAELDNATFPCQDAARAQVDAGQGGRREGDLDLGYTRITAPIDGLIGTTLVKAATWSAAARARC
jgi:multidrug efflux pump subunit AcrA (membrane-fusion protein)